MSTFGYSVSRAITLRYFTRTFFVFGIIWIIIITIINVVVVGYETVPVTSTAFYSANKLWYEGFSLGTYYVSRTCNATIVKMHEGSRREDAEDRSGYLFSAIRGIQS
jgi:hypothetical protein